MILTRGSGRAARGGEGDAHGLGCGRLASGARMQAVESERAGLGSSEWEHGADRAEGGGELGPAGRKQRGLRSGRERA